MAARKIQTPKSSAAHAFVVVLEEIRAQNRVFGEGQELLREQMSAGFEAINRRVERVENDVAEIRRDVVEIRRDVVEIRRDVVEIRRDVVEIRRDVVEIRQDIVEIRQDVNELQRDMGLVKIAVLEHSRELRAVRAGLEKKVDRDDIGELVERAMGGAR